MMELKITAISETHLAQVSSFLDIWSGDNFLSTDELLQIIGLSIIDGQSASFLAWHSDKLVGVRLTYAPGKLLNRVKGLSLKDWKVSPAKVGYFKSLFVAEEYRQLGIGKKLSEQSLSMLKKMGAEAVLCHSWLESPNDSSQRYLQKMGFQVLKQHPRYWEEINYQCVRCAPQKCQCTAVEMIKYIS